MLEHIWRRVDSALELLNKDAAAMNQELRDCLAEIQLIPDALRDSGYYYLCGYINYSMRPQQLAEAASCFQRALNLDPSDSYSRLYLGHCYYDCGSYEMAKECFLAVEKALLPNFLQMKVDEMVLCCELRQFGFSSRLRERIQLFLREYMLQNFCDDYPFELKKTLNNLGANLEAEKDYFLRH